MIDRGRLSLLFCLKICIYYHIVESTIRTNMVWIHKGFPKNYFKILYIRIHICDVVKIIHLRESKENSHQGDIYIVSGLSPIYIPAAG